MATLMLPPCSTFLLWCIGEYCLLAPSLPPDSHIELPLALIPPVHWVPLLPAGLPTYMPLGGFPLYQNSFFPYLTLENIPLSGSLLIRSVFWGGSLSLFLSLMSNNLAWQCYASNMSVLVNPFHCSRQASCLLMEGAIHKCSSVIPKERRKGDGLGAEFRITPCHFCPLPETRISIRKLPIC